MSKRLKKKESRKELLRQLLAKTEQLDHSQFLIEGYRSTVIENKSLLGGIKSLQTELTKIRNCTCSEVEYGKRQTLEIRMQVDAGTVVRSLNPGGSLEHIFANMKHQLYSHPLIKDIVRNQL